MGPFNSFCLPLPLFLNYSDICSHFCLVGTLINKAHRNYVVYGLEMVLALITISYKVPIHGHWCACISLSLCSLMDKPDMKISFLKERKK
jgi:hypothetical protein